MVRSMEAIDGASSGRRSQDSEEDAQTARHRQYARARRREAAGASSGVLSSLRQVGIEPVPRSSCMDNCNAAYDVH